MLTVEQAQAMGKKGAPHSEHERLLYEAYCKGHCWATGPWLADKGYYDVMTDRIRFAMWRDRGALEAAATAEARALVGQMLEAHHGFQAAQIAFLAAARAKEPDDVVERLERAHQAAAAELDRAAGNLDAWLGEAQKGDGHHG